MRPQSYSRRSGFLARRFVPPVKRRARTLLESPTYAARRLRRVHLVRRSRLTCTPEILGGVNDLGAVIGNEQAARLIVRQDS